TLGPRSLEGNILRRASPYDHRLQIVRGSPDKPRPIAIHRDICLPVTIIVPGHWNIPGCASPYDHGFPTVRGSPDKPRPITIHRDICLPVTIIVSGHWNVLGRTSPYDHRL